jgi:chemotaxis signal transduction protein
VKDERRERTFDWEAVHQRLAKVNAALEALGGASADVGESAMRQIWARRAAVLAEGPPEDDDGEQIELVVMRLGEELYALEARFVFDIRPFERITSVPRTPSWIAGVVNHRGRILSVIDLRRFFDLPETEDEDIEVTPRASTSGGLASDTRHSSLAFAESQPKFADAANSQYLIVVEVPVPEALVVSETSVSSEISTGAEAVSPVELALLTGPVLTLKLISINRIQDAARVVLDIEAEYVRGVVECDIRGEESVVIIVDLQALLADKRLFVYEEIL